MEEGLMDFTKKDFSNFQYEIKNAMQDICAKYQVKVKCMHVSYSEVDFDLKISFEKNESGLNTERIQFETECEYYGFTPDDYLRTFIYKENEYELAGFVRNAKKYNCRVRHIESGKEIRINNIYLCQLFDQEIQSASDLQNKTQHEENNSEDIDWNVINILSDQELSTLSIKLSKSKRSEKDWTIIKGLLKGKEMLTFAANSNVPWVSSIEGIALEKEALLVYTNKTDLQKHLEELYISGDIHAVVNVKSYSFEDILQTAAKHNTIVLFDITNDKGRRYLSYIPSENELKAGFLA